MLTPNQERLFWEKVSKTETCWLWTASVGWNGYGMFGKPTRRAHLVAIELAGVTLKPGELGLHKCNTPRCVRYHPEHVYVGDLSQNAIDSWHSGARNEAEFKHALSLATQGSNNPAAKLTEAQVLEIRKRYKEGLVGRARRSSVTYQMLADEYGVKYQTVKFIVTNRTWRHL